jgi:formylglycine-generating enzyme required for sulfatase activity
MFIRLFIVIGTALLLATCDSPEQTKDDDTTETDSYVVPDDIGAMVDVPAGEFMMGCNEGVACPKDESPYHAVTLSTFKIGKYEVTAGEYQNCITAGACVDNNTLLYLTNTDDPVCNLYATGKKNHPMNCVNWYGAKAYCEWVGARLPTEAEWEKAARGTDGRRYPWGNDWASCDYAIMVIINGTPNQYHNGCGTESTWPVGSKKAGMSPYGAYDMAGNVLEWVNDRYISDYYASSPTNNPTGPEDVGAIDYVVLRGGSWADGLEIGDLRVSNRVRSYTIVNYPLYYGFRCAK